MSLDTTSALQRADLIRSKLSNLVADRDQVLALIRQAREQGDHEALGYPSWTAYIGGEFGGLLPKLDRAERRSLVVQLRSLGMSTRAIAPVVGVHHDTVARDVQRVVSTTPEPESPAEQVTDESGRVWKITGPRSMSDPAPITGRDGKTYQSQPAVPREPTEHSQKLERQKAAYQPFRALIGPSMETFLDGIDALLEGHDWGDLDKVANRHPQLDARSLALDRLHRLRVHMKRQQHGFILEYREVETHLCSMNADPQFGHVVAKVLVVIRQQPTLLVALHTLRDLGCVGYRESQRLHLLDDLSRPYPSHYGRLGSKVMRRRHLRPATLLRSHLALPGVAV